eukprot:3413623-Amphidinium_carterae.1
MKVFFATGRDLSVVLHAMGCPLRTREEQQQLVRKMDEAKDAARRAGIKERELGKEGNPEEFHYMHQKLPNGLSEVIASVIASVTVL